MKTDKRSNKQNSAYWVFQEQVANEMIAQGITINNIIESLDIRPTKERLHEIIFKQILENKFNKTSTTKMTRGEMNECLEDYMLALANRGLEIYFPDEAKRTLLESYKD